MARKSRLEQRIQQEQETVGMRRAERKEQEELAGKKKLEVAHTRALKLANQKQAESDNRPVRVARAGKPLKRSR